MSDGSNYLDPNRPDAVRLGVSEAQELGEAALARIGYSEDDACIITDQLIDNRGAVLVEGPRSRVGHGRSAVQLGGLAPSRLSAAIGTGRKS